MFVVVVIILKLLLLLKSSLAFFHALDYFFASSVANSPHSICIRQALSLYQSCNPYKLLIEFFSSSSLHFGDHKISWYESLWFSRFWFDVSHCQIYITQFSWLLKSMHSSFLRRIYSHRKYLNLNWIKSQRKNSVWKFMFSPTDRPTHHK